MAEGEMVPRNEFNNAMHAYRRSLEDLKDSLTERLTRIEAKQDSGAADKLTEAEERGRTKQRLDDLERREAARDRKVWALILLGLTGALAGLKVWLASVFARGGAP
jgi:Arc/MetJ-type ribon-helix-helix transcriptional regulator